MTECIHDEFCITCTKCGLVLHNQEYDSNIVYEETIPKYQNSSNSNKYIIWNKWTNEEKNIYAISNYTKQICNELAICDSINYICDLVINILEMIKNDDCSKRANQKKAIIILCIVHALPYYSIEDLKNKLQIDYKYISKAEKNIKELIFKKKIQEFHFKKQEKHKYSSLEELISFCKNNNIIQEHGCSFFIEKHYNPKLKYSEFISNKQIDVSHVTISKIYKKLINEINLD